MKKKDKGDSVPQKAAPKPIKLTGNPTKGAVNFKPTLGNDENPMRYVGQTQAAQSLTPHSSDKKEGDSPIIESYDANKLDLLLKAGLAEYRSYAQYKKALANPEMAKRYSIYRDKSFDVLYKLIEAVTTDPTVFYRVKNNIQKKYDMKKGPMDVNEENSPKPKKKLVDKLVSKFGKKASKCH